MVRALREKCLVTANRDFKSRPGDPLAEVLPADPARLAAGIRNTDMRGLV